MQITALEDGQLLIPVTLCDIAGIRPGETVDAKVENGRIVLIAPEKPHFVGKIIADPVTGFPVLDFGPDAPMLTSEMVAEMLADFP